MNSLPFKNRFIKGAVTFLFCITTLYTANAAQPDTQSSQQQQLPAAKVIMKDDSEVSGVIHQDPVVGTITISRISDSGERIIDILNPVFVKEITPVEVTQQLQDSIGNSTPLNLPLHTTVYKNGGDTVKGYIAPSVNPNEMVIAEKDGRVIETIAQQEIIRITQHENAPATETAAAKPLKKLSEANQNSNTTLQQLADPQANQPVLESMSTETVQPSAQNLYAQSSAIPQMQNLTPQQQQQLLLMQQQQALIQAQQQQSLQQQQTQAQNQPASNPQAVNPHQAPIQNQQASQSQPIATMAQIQLANGLVLEGFAQYLPQFQLLKVTAVDNEGKDSLHFIMAQFVKTFQPINNESKKITPKSPSDLGETLHTQMLLSNGQTIEGQWVPTEQSGTYSILPVNAEKPIAMPLQQVPYLKVTASNNTISENSKSNSDPLEEKVRSNQYTKIIVNDLPENPPAIPGVGTNIKLKTNLEQTFEGIIHEINDDCVVLKTTKIATMVLKEPKLSLIKKKNIVEIESF